MKKNMGNRKIQTETDDPNIEYKIISKAGTGRHFFLPGNWTEFKEGCTVKLSRRKSGGKFTVEVVDDGSAP